MSHILVMESDRIVAKCISDELITQGHTVAVVANADKAVLACDKQKPDVVISELTIPGHSGSEFLYEFRTYTDWLDIPIIIYSSMRPPSEVTKSHDWKLLNIYELLYKPEASLQRLNQSVSSALEL